MKNKYIEKLKQRAKQSHRDKRSGVFQNGIIVRHLYNEENPEKFTWWDDVAFVLNDYLVNVAWCHPRYRYKERVSELARDACSHLERTSVSDFLDGCSPNYRKVGSSRKKIESYSIKCDVDAAYFQELKNLEVQIARDQNNGIVVTPSIFVKWTQRSRFVSICAPIEVRGVNDLYQLVALTKSILKRQTSLHQEFPDYSFSQKNWVAEFEEADSISILSHALKKN